MNNLYIRDARHSDRVAIQEVTLSACQEYATLMPSHWEEYRQDMLATLAEVKPAEQIVAEQNGSLWALSCCTRLEQFFPRPTVSQ